MLPVNPESFILFLQTLSPEILSLLNLLICYIAIIIVTKLWQESGLFIYTSVAIIACNLQVLKAMEFSWYSEPIALGTVLYASTFLVSDILTEIYGAEAAKKSVFLSFAASILLLAFMVLALGFKPLSEVNTSNNHFNEAHNALLTVFTPNAALLFASFAAYIISQFTDIYIFSKLKKLTKNAHLWFRTFSAIMIAALTDSIIFNILAWKVFSPYQVTWSSLFSTYILGAYSLQIIVAIFNIPVFYCLLKFIKFSASSGNK